MADAALALATCDPDVDNGLVVRSGPYLRARGLGRVTVALVTGGGSGIGQATARLLAARGAQVVVADVDGDDRAGDRRGDRRRAPPPFAVDVADGASVEAMVAFAVETLRRSRLGVQHRRHRARAEALRRPLRTPTGSARST